ncbi:prephenate dehydratase [Myxococcus sp. K15C18031901]|uniref:prephenate dehydratase n=1 Tax=Myxococcus dinghuensis TaxID=2906761 RepID=UPI0020A76143|nr:prephenate dehydratase [Myxococcus dinghuensis]MCP3103359.1 prephenate dehydratase [Myxococcus dinghuensis]
MAESPRRVAFQGEHGAYGEEALRALYGPDVEAVPCLTFRGVFEAVAEGRVASGVIPVESSLGGPVAENVDLLLEHDLPISGELSLRVRHCLVAPPGRALEDIERALSHPQALAQCAGYLRRRGITPVPEANTAIAARKVAEEAPPRTAAIASRVSAELYGLTVLEEGVEDSPDNHTRFLTLGAPAPRAWTRRKTALAFTVQNAPGALYRVLGAFSARGLEVSRLESRPQRRAWEYVWCLDVEGSLEDPRVREAVGAAQGACITLRVLGSYGVA